MANVNFTVIVFVLAGGILPALFWLWFWLREDSKKPEPRSLLLLVFLVGAVSVVFAAFFQCVVTDLFVNGGLSFKISRLLSLECLDTRVVQHGWWLVFSWAAIEEIMKLVAAWIATRHRKALDEPVDYMIYLVTAALGFAALENTLYLFGEVTRGGLDDGLTSIAIRFAGATLVHVLSSSVLGGIFALAFCKNRAWKVLHTVIAIVVATSLHAIYNFSIIKSVANGTSSLPALIVLWIGIVLLLVFFEKVKHIVCTVPMRRLGRPEQ